MKRVIAALLILVGVTGMTVLQMNKTESLAREIQDASRVAMEEYAKKNKDGVMQNLNKIWELWEENHMWAHITMSTKQIDEIEISLSQSVAYCEAEAWDDFGGEFSMFCMLIEHLTKQETFSLGELL